MDTRRKILSVPEALETAARLTANGKALTVVTGHFDPMLAAHARRLAAAKGASDLLMAVVTSPGQPVLPARARAELVAALAIVDHVVIPEAESVEAFLGQLGAARIERQESEHQRLANDLAELVRSRRGLL